MKELKQYLEKLIARKEKLVALIDDIEETIRKAEGQKQL